jgi:hypothetical protein
VKRLGGHQAAGILGVSAEALRRRVRRGKLHARKVRGRWVYPASEIHLMGRVGPALLTSTQAARALRRSTQTVNAWADRGLLPYRRGPGGWRWFDRAGVVALAASLQRSPRFHP